MLSFYIEKQVKSCFQQKEKRENKNSFVTIQYVSWASGIWLVQQECLSHDKDYVKEEIGQMKIESRFLTIYY